jgi:hypothetical protein
LAIGRRRAAAYSRAVLAAESGNAPPLAEFVAETLLQSCRRLIAAAGDDALEPLRALAGEHYAALIKAAKRGRLTAVARDGRIFTTAAWIEAYRKSSGRTSEYSAPTPRSRSARPS